MLKPILLLLKILSVITVTLTGVMGMLGKLTDTNGDLTIFGKVNLWIFIIALFLAILVYIVEHFIEEKKDIDDQETLSNNIARQEKILLDIQRSIYAINSVDILISIELSADLPELRNYKNKLDKYLTEYQYDKARLELEFGKEATKIIPNSDPKLREISPVYSMSIKEDSPLFPNDDISAKNQLSFLFWVLISDNSIIDFYHNLPKQILISDMIINLGSDLAIFAPTLFENKKASISYSPTYNTFTVHSRTDNAIITHDTKKIISILDLKDTNITLYSANRPTDFVLKELRVQFNKSLSKNYNSLFSINHDQCEVVSGPNWKLLISQLKQIYK
jgi:hypothetical protein